MTLAAIPADPEVAGTVIRDVMVPMRDGVRLATDIYLPAGPSGPRSVILERTPYNKTGTSHADRTRARLEPFSKPEIAAQFARAGYVYVLQDCRGRYGSGGRFSKYLNEAEDGFDTLTWLADQPWCDGRIGMTGLSYSAHVQAAVAALGHPSLAALFMDSGGFSSGYHSGIRQGGAFELKQLTWAYRHALLAPATAADPVRRTALEAEVRAANRELAAAIAVNRGDTPEVQAAVDHFHTAMGDLQKATLAHIFEMRSVLTPAQAEVFDAAVADALRRDAG